MKKSLLDHFIGRISLGILVLLYFSKLLFNWIQSVDIQSYSYNTLGFISSFNFANFWLDLLLNFVFALLSIFIWGQILRRYKLIEGSKWPIYLLFITGFSVFPELFSSNSAIAFGLLALGASYYFFQVYNQANIKLFVFISSILLGLGGLIYSPSFLYLIVLWIGLALIRPFDIKVYLLSLIGFLLPYIYFYSISYLTEFQAEPLLEIGSFFEFKLKSSKDWTELVFLFFLFTIGLYNLSLRSKMIVLVRNQKAYLFIHLVCSIFLVLFWAKEAIFIAFFPAGTFVQNAYDELTKKWVMELILILFLLFQLSSPFFL